MSFENTVYNINPYYDDFDATKKFLRVLFRPGYSVQARELTQIQTILHNQMKTFGDHIFENGSLIAGGQISESAIHHARIQPASITVSTDSGVTYVAATTAQITTAFSDSVGVEFGVGNTNYADGIGRIVDSLEQNDTTLDVYDHLYFDFLTGGTTIVAGSIIEFELASGVRYRFEVKTQNSDNLPVTGRARIVTTQAAIYFVDGSFVISDAQTTVPYVIATSTNNMDGTETVATDGKMFEDPTARIGFTVVNTIVTSDDDETLKDPANGFPNFTAPGADRLKKDLTLGFVEFDVQTTTTISLDGHVSDDFIEILRYEAGVATKREIFPDYSVIEENLARRSFDQAGNYTVSDFDIQVREHLDDTTNEGIYTAGNGGDESKLVTVLEPGSAYILGNKFETISRTFVPFDKARTSDSEDDKVVDVNVGNYVIIGGSVGASMPNGFSVGVSYLHSEDHPELQLIDGAGASFGTALFRQLDVENAALNEYRLYLYDINLNSGGDFADTEFLFASTGRAIGLISITSGVDGSSNAIQFLPTKDSLVIPLPVNSSIKTVDNVDFDTQLTFEATAVAGEINVSTSPVPVIFPGDTDAVIASSHLNNRYFLINVTANTYIEDFTGITFTTSSGNTALEVTGLNGTDVYRVIANCEVNTTDVNFSNVMRVKTLGASETISGITLGSNIFSGVTFGNIERADIYTLEAVVGASVDPGTDLTSRFDLDDGQRDNLYDHGKILLKAGASAGDTTFDVTIRRFTHSGGDGPIVVDSYPVGTAYDGVTFEYDNIPSFTSNKTGVVKSLRDVIDFRPLKADDGTVSDAWIPVAKETMAASFSYYLPRIDRVTLSKDREFKIVTGIPSLTPIAPDVDPDSMTLYSLRLGAYTFDPSDVEAQHHDTKRFTMKDIGQIEKRVDDLEYFTSLSFLEQDANSRTFLTTSNVVIPKVGILVDNFNGHEIGDVNHIDFNCSMDFSDGTLRPAFKTENISLTEDTTVSLVNMVNNNGIYTLEHTTLPDITSPLADNTNIVNPTDRIDWYGDLDLSPTSDDWYGDAQRAAVRSNKYGINNAWEYRGNRTESPFGFGTQWKDWEYNWFGLPLSDFEVGPQDLNSNERVFDTTFAGSADATRNRFVEFLSNNQIESRSISSDARKNIAKNSTPDSVFKKIGNRKHNTSIQPYNRLNTVVCAVTGMKPLTTYYVFVDNVQVATSTTDSKGEASQTIVLAAGDTRTGDALVRFIDDSNNNIENATTVAEAVYRIGGSALTQDSDITSTRPHKTKRSSVASSNIISETLTRNITDGSAVNDLDAMAQNFTIDKNRYPKGMFAKSVDLMFSAKPGTFGKDIPVTIELRPTVSGYPHPSKIIPGTVVAKYKADVDIAADTDFTDSSNRTRFTFDFPVYLEPGEYSIMIRTNSKKYSLYSGVIGNAIASSERITQQPFVGKFFRPQNAGTYISDNTQKLTFALNRCKFDTTSGTVSFRNLTFDITENFTYDSYYIHSGHMDFGKSGVDRQLSYQIRTTPNSSGLLESSARDIAVNQTVSPVKSNSTQIAKVSDKTIVLSATMSTDDDAISPIIDSQRLSVVAVQNNVNTASSTISTSSDPQYNGELDPSILDTVSSSIVSVSRYISKSVVLDDGVAATDARVILDINQQSGTNIQVFIKALSDTDTVELDGKGYIELEPQTTVISESDDIYTEVEYKVSDSTVFGSFDVFVVKIVLHTGDQFIAPKVRDMRVVALA